MSSLPSARWIAAAAMCVFLALTLLIHAFAEISDRDSGESRIAQEVRDILTTDEAREDYEALQDEDDGGFRIPGTDIEIGLGDSTSLTYDEFVERATDGLSSALYEGGPDEADRILAALSIEQGSDSPLNFFADPEDQGFLEDLLEDEEEDPLAFFESGQAPLADEFAEIFAEVGDDDGLTTLDAHEVVTRLRLTFLLLTLLTAAVLAFLVSGAARLLAPAAVAAATTFPFAIVALLLYLVLRPDEEVSLGSLIEILDISIGDILRDYMISFGLSLLAVIAGLIWSVAAAERPRRYFERAFPARSTAPRDQPPPPARTH